MIKEKCPRYVTDIIRGFDVELPADPMTMINFMLHPNNDLISPIVKLELTFTVEDSVPLIKGLVPILNRLSPNSEEEFKSLPDGERAALQFLLEVVQAVKAGWDTGPDKARDEFKQDHVG